MQSNHTTPATDKASRAAELRTRVDNCLSVCQLEMHKKAPDLDHAYEYAYKAMRHIETLRIMTIGGSV